MIGYLDIKAKLIERLGIYLKDVPVMSNNVVEGFSKPCLFVKFGNTKVSDSMGKFQERTLKVRIIYFPENEEDILNKMDLFSDCFVEKNELELEQDFITTFDDIEIIEIDKVLHCNFKMYLCEEYIRKETNEIMNDLEFKEE